MLAQFLSKRLAVVVATIAIGFLPTLTEKITQAIDWKIYALVGVYVLLQTGKDIAIAVIDKKQAAESE